MLRDEAFSHFNAIMSVVVLGLKEEFTALQSVV